jgi:hypothetical protein
MPLTLSALLIRGFKGFETPSSFFKTLPSRCPSQGKLKFSKLHLIKIFVKIFLQHASFKLFLSQITAGLPEFEAERGFHFDASLAIEASHLAMYSSACW